MLIAIIRKGKDNYFSVGKKVILLNKLKISISINIILKHSLLIYRTKTTLSAPACFGGTILKCSRLFAK